MRRTTHLLVVLAAAAGLTVLPSGSAHAFGAETLACRISPGPTEYQEGWCWTSNAASSYSIGFAVQNGSGTYTYSWTVSGYYTSTSGCTSTSSYCGVTAPAFGNDNTIDATVTITQGGQSNTLRATAYVPGVCGNELC